MTVLAYLGSHHTKFHAIVKICWAFNVLLFGVIYPAWCDFTIDLTACVHQILFKSQKYDWDPGNDYTSIQGRKHEPYTESPKSLTLKEARQVKSRVKGTLIILFDIKGTVHKELVQAGQTVNSTYCCDHLWWPWKCAKSSPRLQQRRKKKIWLLHHNNAHSHTSLFTREITEYFTISNMTVLSPISVLSGLGPLWLFSVPQLRMLPFWHNCGD
jgi:hypothetical protein